MGEDLLDRYIWDRLDCTYRELEEYVENAMDLKLGTVVVKAITLRALVKEHYEYRKLLGDDDR